MASKHDLAYTANRYDQEHGRSKDLHIEICHALAESSLNVHEAARKIFRSPSDLRYHINKMRRSGFDPLDFYQLIAALGYVKQEDQP